MTSEVPYVIKMTLCERRTDLKLEISIVILTDSFALSDFGP